MQAKLYAGLLVAAGITMVGAEASAADDWSLLGGTTVAARNDILYGELGWPDATFGWAHGVTDRFDIGARFSLIYGVESTRWTDFGVGLRFPLRFQLTRRAAKVSALFHMDPGLKLYATRPVEFGVQFPVGVNVGVHVTHEATVAFGLDVPVSLFVTPGVAFVLAPMFGPGFEYHFDRRIGLTLNTRFGAALFGADRYSYFVPGYRSHAEFAFLTQVGVVYHL